VPAEHDLLVAGLLAAGVDAALAERLAAYGAMLLDANRRVNLTGAKDAAALLPHLLDALTLANDVRESLVDVGSGGGLPGIPLALATGARVLLVEPIAKKAAFLERAVADLGIDGVIVAGRAETAARDPRYREQFLFATARAVANPSTVAELTVPFLRVGGRALLQRGALEAAERQAVADAAPMLGANLAEERIVDGQRRIVILAKQATTGLRFPRRNGVPEKRPLCTQLGR
jgi:16S rRNA (guanine527-N7)-methyltransferase